MKSKINIILVLISITGICNTYAQRGEWVNQVIVVNSGKFESGPNYQDYVTVQAYDPVLKTVKVFDTIYTQSAQDVVIDGHFAYVAAQDSIIKYDIDNYQRVAAIADSGMANLCLYNNKLIVSKQYPIKRFFVEVLDETLSLVHFVEGISGDCGGISADGNSIYVAVNHGWLGTEGRLAVISTDTWTLTKEINFGADAVGICNLYNYDGGIFSINKTPLGHESIGSLTVYNISSGYYSNKTLDYLVGDGAGIDNNLLYLKINEGIGSYNLDTQTIVDPAIVPDPGSASRIYILSARVDYLNNRLYLNIGTRLVNGFGVITSLTGDSITSFPEGISADCIAIDYRTPVGIQVKGTIEMSFSLWPNPVDDLLSVKFNGSVLSSRELSVIDLTGRIIYEKRFINGEKSLTISCENFPAGIYFISLKTDNGITTKKFFKK